jgi:hypothetical protein
MSKISPDFFENPDYEKHVCTWGWWIFSEMDNLKTGKFENLRLTL